MKYELGDKVRITKYWRKVSLPTDFEEFLKDNQEELAGEGILYQKYKSISIDEVGIIVGKRKQKISTRLSYEFEGAIDVGVGIIPEFKGIRQLDSEHIEVYLVATRMNCLRRVNFEDIEFIE